MAIKIWRNTAEKRRDKFIDDVKEFCTDKKRSKYFVMIADTETNTVVAGYQGMVSGFHNKSEEHLIKEAFEFAPHFILNERNEPEEIEDPIDSKRNQAIKQLLFEIDGLIDAFGKKIYNNKQSEEFLADALKKGDIKAMGVKDEQGKVKELITAEKLTKK